MTENIGKKVTVAIPVFNGKKFISDALQSIIDQTYNVDYIIVCDNHSNDNTVKIVKQFISMHKDVDIGLKINEKNIGIQKNLNKCMELCQSDFLLILCADDRLKPYTIEKQLNFFNNHTDLALVGGLRDIIDEKGKSLRKAKKTENKLYKKGQILELVKNKDSYIPFSTVLFNMKYIRRIGYFDENITAPDEIYWPKVLHRYPIAILGESLMDLREHSGQERNSEWSFKQKEMISLIEEKMKIANYESDPDRVKKIKKELGKIFSFVSLMYGNGARRKHQEYWVCIKYWLFAVKLYPPILFTKKYLKSWIKLILFRY